MVSAGLGLALRVKVVGMMTFKFTAMGNGHLNSGLRAELNVPVTRELHLIRFQDLSVVLSR